MNKSLIAFAALATFAGAAHAKEQPGVMSGGSAVNVGTMPSAEARSIDAAAGSFNPSAITVLGELPVTTVASACGCYPSWCGS